MKRLKLIRHLEKHGCILLREGGNHAIYLNPKNQRRSAVGRHRELADLLCEKICKQLEVPGLK
ncbi:MAG: type II toxin-antitoxin system HicA family toxin [Flavobacteriales bacterium]|jgi:predicted RNA binding protein YcfA (HicA-like mRNA interferase family)|nr:type II toxin-antitoxin system HicA family toxin [Flavobacteriales bacterium]MBK6893234.1 type II toxin-antitoxin system HicA family toxin [Flavobacteriales bacterium]MBK7249034.1 type II toxin-antitoxin system HicA family toxin [Flavobacteriales bacterium]MBK7285607.1 type II toxin-antitoxin system HicA family toxin [Flavobacteriales bacterium]MBK9058722.1 type II toxin-antitoxin system HicA family toxin [Flavobacteriales bacterium]